LENVKSIIRRNSIVNDFYGVLSAIGCDVDTNLLLVVSRTPVDL